MPNVCGKSICSSINFFQARSSAPSSAPRRSKSSPAPFASGYHPIPRRPHGLPPSMPTFDGIRRARWPTTLPLPSI
ncbi:hypothetical protein IAS59_004484 [Cryptococcus gattii]